MRVVTLFCDFRSSVRDVEGSAARASLVPPSWLLAPNPLDAALTVAIALARGRALPAFTVDKVFERLRTVQRDCGWTTGMVVY